MIIIDLGGLTVAILVRKLAQEKGLTRKTHLCILKIANYRKEG
jgi:hypothetical protein